MPLVFRFDGLRVVVYPNDHRPAHVHVKGSAGEAVFVLHCPNGPPAMPETFGFNRSEIGWITTRIADALTVLCAEWRAVHGRF